MHYLDEIDLKIIDLLQGNARIRRSDLAEKVSLTLPAVTERLKKLQDRGLIKKFNVVIDYKQAGYDLTAFVFVYMESSKFYSQFVQKVMDEPEILECHSITGEGSHILKVITENSASLEKILAKIQSWPGVKGTRTNVVLSTLKENQKIKVLTKERK